MREKNRKAAKGEEKERTGNAITALAHQVNENRARIGCLEANQEKLIAAFTDMEASVGDALNEISAKLDVCMAQRGFSDFQGPQQFQTFPEWPAQQHWS